MHSTISLSALVLAISALRVHAFHVESGTACSSVGASCSYVSDDSSNGGSTTTTVSGFCAPDLLCASNGASCSTDDECFNYCGSDGTCGGEGAGCNTQDTFTPGQSGIACSDGFTCSAADGQVGSCQAATSTTNSTVAALQEPASPGASQASARRNKRRLSDEYRQHQVKARDLRIRKHI